MTDIKPGQVYREENSAFAVAVLGVNGQKLRVVYGCYICNRFVPLNGGGATPSSPREVRENYPVLVNSDSEV